MDILAALPQLVDLVQKGGVVGLLLIVVGAAVWEVLRLRKDLARTYAERDNYRLYYAVYRQACEQHDPPVKVDTSSLAALPALPAPA